MQNKKAGNHKKSGFKILIFFQGFTALTVSLSELCFSSERKNFLWKINIEATPIVIAESAILKTGLKNVKDSPPQIGNHFGK
jgi:hypothetical protein